MQNKFSNFISLFYETFSKFQNYFQQQFIFENISLNLYEILYLLVISNNINDIEEEIEVNKINPILNTSVNFHLNRFEKKQIIEIYNKKNHFYIKPSKIFFDIIKKFNNHLNNNEKDIFNHLIKINSDLEKKTLKS